MSEPMTFRSYGPGPVYSGLEIWLPLLMIQHETVQRTGPIIQGKSFIDCRLRGPSVIIPMSGCEFDSCNLGASDGDIRNLMFSPLGSTKLTGGIALQDCKFIRCDFLGVGFTGSPEFLEELGKIGGLPA